MEGKNSASYQKNKANKSDLTVRVVKFSDFQGSKLTVATELQIIFAVVSVFTKENFNPFSNLISPFGIGTHEIQWLFGIFLTHNWSPIYLLL